MNIYKKSFFILGSVAFIFFFSHLKPLFAQEDNYPYNEGGYYSQGSYAPTATPTPSPTPTPSIGPVGTNVVVNFGVAIPVPPTITANPPTPTGCSVNNPTVSFTYSSAGAVWFKVFSDASPSTPLYSGPNTSFSETLGTTYNTPSNYGGSYHYSVWAYFVSNPGPSDIYAVTTTTGFTFTNCYYSVSGIVFVDTNRDGIKDPSESNFTSSAINISLTGQTTQPTVSGAYTFTNLLAGSYTVQIGTLPTGYVLSPGQTSSRSLTLSGASVENFAITPVYSLGCPSVPGGNGTVYIDHDRNGSYNTGDVIYAGATLTLTGTLTYGDPTFAPLPTTSSATGTYCFPNLYPGTYTVTITNPSPTRYDIPVTQGTFTIPPSTTSTSFAMRPLYQISGVIFNDQGKDGIKNGAEPNMTGSHQITLVGPSGNPTAHTPITTSNGIYTFTNLPEGQYTVSYTPPLPTGYLMTNPPPSISPPSFTVTIGRSCSINSAVGALCISAGFPFSASDVQDLNFGMTNSIPWFQCIGSSCNIEGTIDNIGNPQIGFSNPIPSTALLACGGANASIPGTNNPQPGIIFSGGTAYFGQGQASTPQNWSVSDYTNDTTLIRTSYGYMTTTLRQSSITPIDLTSVCTLSNCTLPADLANGVYLAETNVVLNAYTFPANKSFVILVNGNLDINGEIHIPVGSATTFSVSGNITVDRSVGVGIGNFCSQTANIEGFFSTDRSFIIEGLNDCSLYSNPLQRDQRLNIAGGIVVNAGLSSGSLQNQRDLCDDDLKAPAFSIISRPDFILNSPEFIKYKSDVWQEVAP